MLVTNSCTNNDKVTYGPGIFYEYYLQLSFQDLSGNDLVKNIESDNAGGIKPDLLYTINVVYPEKKCILLDFRLITHLALENMAIIQVILIWYFIHTLALFVITKKSGFNCLRQTRLSTNSPVLSYLAMMRCMKSLHGGNPVKISIECNYAIA